MEMKPMACDISLPQELISDLFYEKQFSSEISFLLLHRMNKVTQSHCHRMPRKHLLIGLAQCSIDSGVT